MSVYTLAYDLVKETGSHDYEPLWAELKRLDAHRVQYSFWLVNLNNNSKEVHDHFKAYLDENDRLFVDRLRKNENWYSGAMAGTNAWLERNPPD